MPKSKNSFFAIFSDIHANIDAFSADRTVCAFGVVCSYPTQSFLAKFPDEFERRVK